MKVWNLSNGSGLEFVDPRSEVSIPPHLLAGLFSFEIFARVVGRNRGFGG